MTDGQSSFESLAARLQLLEDKQELTELLDKYCKSPDRFDYKSHADTYVQDGTQWYGPWAVVEGRQTIQDKVAEALHDVQSQMHYMTNMNFEIKGDTAKGTSYLMMIIIRESTKPTDGFWHGGPYEWEFVRTPDGWRIKTMKLRSIWLNKQDPNGTFTTTVAK